MKKIIAWIASLGQRVFIAYENTLLLNLCLISITVGWLKFRAGIGLM